MIQKTLGERRWEKIWIEEVHGSNEETGEVREYNTGGNVKEIMCMESINGLNGLKENAAVEMRRINIQTEMMNVRISIKLFMKTW